VKEEGMSAFRTAVLLRSEQTGGEISVIENTVPAGWEGPPLHRHDFDETFYVLEGELTFRVGDELFTAAPGGLAFARRGDHHTLANATNAEARYLLVCTPGGFERYFDRIAAEQAGVAPPASASKPYPETIVVGPRIGEDR
jgi:quercetin dioxygenase-like cupin family protein